MPVTTEIQQLPADTRIEHGWPRKFLALTTDDLHERAGLRWDRRDDDLGKALVAVVDTGPATPTLALHYYEEAPEPGVLVIADESVSESAIRRGLAALGVDTNEIRDPASPVEPSADVVVLKQELESASARLDAVEKLAAAARAAANRATAAIHEAARAAGARKTTGRSAGARKTTARSSGSRAPTSSRSTARKSTGRSAGARKTTARSSGSRRAAS
jgi:hypothetical protein